MDHNLLDFGDGVVIGANVHVSGHTVEAGVVKTAPVRPGRGVTVGWGSPCNHRSAARRRSSRKKAPPPEEAGPRA